MRMYYKTQGETSTRKKKSFQRKGVVRVMPMKELKVHQIKSKSLPLCILHIFFYLIYLRSCLRLRLHLLNLSSPATMKFQLALLLVSALFSQGKKSDLL